MSSAFRTLSLAAELRCLEQATRFVRGGAAEAGLPAERVAQLDLVVEELFVNVTRYAYPGSERGTVKIVYEVPRPGLLMVELSDWGVAYNPLTQPEPILSDSLDARPIGGLGIYLSRLLTDSLDYRREGESNRLRFAVSASSTAAGGE